MQIHEIIDSLSEANSIIMKSRIRLLNTGVILEKMRRVSDYLEKRIAEEFAAVQE